MQSPAGEETAIIPQSKPYCGDGICDGPEIGTWEFVKGTGRALFEPPETNILRELDDRGHEIGVHTHQSEEIANVFNELHEMCGIEARTISGFLLDTDNAGLEGAQQAVSYDILISLQFGDSLPTSLSTCLV
ncbi:MAG: hypothetical protein GTO14_15075 [Anaerolineales bacterium]|nr:hypothetical protein [Anaerolineales bacterium]